MSDKKTDPANDVSYVITLDETILERHLDGGHTADVSPFDLYDSIIQSLRSENSRNVFLADTYKRASERLLSKIEGLETSLRDAIKSRDEVANSLINGITADVIAQPCNKCAGLELEIEEAKESYAKLENQLQLAVSESNTIQLNLNSALESLAASQLAIEARDLKLSNLEQLASNKLATVEGNHKDTVKGLQSTLNSLKTANEKLARELEVSNNDFARMKGSISKRKTETEAMAKILESMRSRGAELTQELATVRTDRRYLGMMIDAIIHENFFNCPEGGASIFSLQTLNVSSPEDEFVIDENYPIGLWLGSNGFSCIMGVSVDCNEKGERSLVMPASAKISKRAMTDICPPAKHHGKIVEGLMQFDVKACNAALDNTRTLVSQFAIRTEFEENAMLTNKNLIATSSRPVAGGRTVVPTQKTHSAKRAKKRR